jgi:hypothetical protein
LLEGDPSLTTIVGFVTSSAKEYDNTIKSIQLIYYSEDSKVCSSLSSYPTTKNLGTESFKLGRVLYPVFAVLFVMWMVWLLTPCYFCYYIFFYRSRRLEKTEKDLYIEKAKFLEGKILNLDKEFLQVCKSEQDFETEIERISKERNYSSNQRHAK